MYSALMGLARHAHVYTDASLHVAYSYRCCCSVISAVLSLAPQMSRCGMHLALVCYACAILVGALMDERLAGPDPHGQARRLQL